MYRRLDLFMPKLLNCHLYSTRASSCTSVKVRSLCTKYRVIGHGVVGLLATFIRIRSKMSLVRSNSPPLRFHAWRPPYCSRDIHHRSWRVQNLARAISWLLSLLLHFVPESYISNHRFPRPDRLIIHHQVQFGNWRHDTDSLRMKDGKNNLGIHQVYGIVSRIKSWMINRQLMTRVFPVSHPSLLQDSPCPHLSARAPPYFVFFIIRP